MEGWHIFILIIFEVLLFVYLQQAIGLMMTLISVIAIAVIAVGGTLGNEYIRKMKRSANGESFRRGGLDTNDAKYLAAQHMLSNHHVDIFLKDSGSPDPEETRYRIRMISEMFEPDEGEEYWVVRMRIHEEDSFGGLDTKIVIYINGDGDVQKDYVMNSELILDDRLWHNPELWFRGIVPVTRKALSPKSILARKIAEKGEIPPEVGAQILKDEIGK